MTQAPNRLKKKRRINTELTNRGPNTPKIQVYKFRFNSECKTHKRANPSIKIGNILYNVVKMNNYTAFSSIKKILLFFIYSETLEKLIICRKLKKSGVLLYNNLVFRATPLRFINLFIYIFHCSIRLLYDWRVNF
jgi:hypothetical protein